MNFGSMLTGLVTGASEAGVNELNKRRDTRLALYLKNEELKAQREQLRSSPELSKFLVDNVMGPTASVPDGGRLYDPDSKILAGLLSTGIKADAAKNIADLKLNHKNLTPKVVSVGNQVIQYRVDPETNRLVDPMPLGKTPAAQRKISEAYAAYAPVEQILGEFKNRVQGSFDAMSFPDNLRQYGKLTLNQLSQSDPKAKAMFDQIAAFTPRFSRALGDSRISDQDRQALVGAFPTGLDTLETALQKIQDLDTNFQAARDGSILAYGGSLNDNPLAPMENKKNKPLGGLGAGFDMGKILSRAKELESKK